MKSSNPPYRKKWRLYILPHYTLINYCKPNTANKKFTNIFSEIHPFTNNIVYARLKF